MTWEPSEPAAGWEPPGRPRRRRGRIVFWVLVGLSVVAVVAGVVLAIFGIIRFFVRRSRARRMPRASSE